MMLKSSCSTIESSSRSIRGRGYGSFRRASLFKSVKSTHTLHFLFFFCTNTTFAIQSRWSTWTMNCAFLSLSVSASMILLHFVPWFRLRWNTGLVVGSRWRRWQISKRLIPGMSSADYASTSMFAHRKLANTSFSRSVSFESIWDFHSSLSGSRLM